MQRIFRLPMSQRSSFILKRRPKFRNGRRRRNRPWFGRRSNFQRGGRGAALLWAAVCLRRGSLELIRALRAEKKRLKGLKNDHGAKAPSDSGKRTDVQKHKCVKLSNSAKCALLTVFEALLAALLLCLRQQRREDSARLFFPQIPVSVRGFTVLTVIFGLMPALSAAFAIEARLMPVFKKPRPLPRLSLRGGIGEENRTLVAVPVLITSEKSVRQAAETLEAHYLAAQDFAAANCGAEFAILADFPDSAEKTKRGEAELIELAKKLTDDLNSRFAPAEGRCSIICTGNVFSIRRTVFIWAGSVSAVRWRHCLTVPRTGIRTSFCWQLSGYLQRKRTLSLSCRS